MDVGVAKDPLLGPAWQRLTKPFGRRDKVINHPRFGLHESRQFG